METGYLFQSSSHISGWQARLDPALCAVCLFQLTERCRAKPQKQDPPYLLAFASQEILSANRRKEYHAHRGDGHNLRSIVEATVRSVKHPIPAGKTPVRGQFRVTCMAIASAAKTNVRRIQRYQVVKTKAEQAAKITKSEPNGPSTAALFSFFGFLWATILRWMSKK